MKNNIHYTYKAQCDLDEIWDYISFKLKNPTAAERVINRIMDNIDQLEEFLELGTPLSSIASTEHDYRFLVGGSYMIFYRAQGRDVYIDRVLYGRGDYMSVLFSDQPFEETTE